MILEIEERRAQIEALCHRYAVARLEVFSSATTAAFSASDSDLDFLVEFRDSARPGYADRYFGLLESLQELFDRPIDLIVDSAITNPYFRASIMRSKALLYAA